MNRFASVDDLLADARSRLDRVTAREAAAEIEGGARLVDIRPAWQRARTGEIPGALVVERNHLEWRLHPDSGARVPQSRAGQRWLVICAEGYTSSLAADALNSIGIPATDVIGGFAAWQEAGLSTVPGVTGPDSLVPLPGAPPAETSVPGAPPAGTSVPGAPPAGTSVPGTPPVPGTPQAGT